MQTENKGNYILISSDENLFSDFHKSFLEVLPTLEKQHIVMHISNEINILEDNFLLYLPIAEQKKEKGTSFVIINDAINIDDFPENFNIVPTLIEAEDILEMEAMERELGF